MIYSSIQEYLAEEMCSTTTEVRWQSDRFVFETQPEPGKAKSKITRSPRMPIYTETRLRQILNPGRMARLELNLPVPIAAIGARLDEPRGLRFWRICSTFYAEDVAETGALLTPIESFTCETAAQMILKALARRKMSRCEFLKISLPTPTPWL